MKDRRWIALCAAGLAVLVMMNLPDAASSRVKGVVRDGISPLQSGLKGGMRGVREILRYVRGVGDMALENRALSEEIVYLRGEMRMARDLERENQLLREQLGFVERPQGRQLIPCEVVGRDSTGWWATARLDKGRKDGVAEGRAVITTEGLAGRTVAVSERTTDVLLVSDPTCKVSVRLERTGVSGVSSGTGADPGGGAACRVEYLPRTADVREGDEVVTSGMGGLFPKGLLLGRVLSVRMDESGMYQTAEVETAANTAEMEYAFVSATEGDLLEVVTEADAEAGLEASGFVADVPELPEEEQP